MSWRSSWEEEGQGATVGGVPRRSLTFVLLVGAAVVTLANLLAVKGWLPFNPSRILGLTLDNAPFVYPFVTYVLPHDPYDLLHLVVNGLVLWMLGSEIEQRFGRGPFATLFFGGAFVGAVAHVAASAAFGDDRPLIGASGGLFALIFFVARDTPNRPFYLYFIRVPARILAALLLVFEIHPVFLEGLQGNVAHLCHLGGAAFGFVWCRHRFDLFAWWGPYREARARDAAATAARNASAGDAEMDRLLRKIHDDGMNSLTDAERDFLRRRSATLREGRR